MNEINYIFFKSNLTILSPPDDLLTGSYESRIRRSSLIPTVANGTAKVQQAKIDALNINGINLNGDEKIVKKTQAEVHSRPH